MRNRPHPHPHPKSPPHTHTLPHSPDDRSVWPLARAQPFTAVPPPADDSGSGGGGGAAAEGCVVAGYPPGLSSGRRVFVDLKVGLGGGVRVCGGGGEAVLRVSVRVHMCVRELDPRPAPLPGSPAPCRLVSGSGSRLARACTWNKL